jgi:hypothetical protein
MNDAKTVPTFVGEGSGLSCGGVLEFVGFAVLSGVGTGVGLVEGALLAEVFPVGPEESSLATEASKTHAARPNVESAVTSARWRIRISLVVG